jgi:hypothetical protein
MKNGMWRQIMRNELPAMLTLNHRVAPQPQIRSVILAASHWRSTTLLSLFVTCVFLIGFIVRAQDSRPVSGFLGDYSGLVPDAKNGDLLLYEKDPNVLKKYNKFIFDPVTIYLLPEAQARGIDPDDLERLAQYFHKAVTDELAKSGVRRMWVIVFPPGPGPGFSLLAGNFAREWFAQDCVHRHINNHQ